MTQPCVAKEDRDDESLLWCCKGSQHLGGTRTFDVAMVSLGVSCSCRQRAGRLPTAGQHADREAHAAVADDGPAMVETVCHNCFEGHLCGVRVEPALKSSVKLRAGRTLSRVGKSAAALATLARARASAVEMPRASAALDKALAMALAVRLPAAAWMGAGNWTDGGLAVASARASNSTATLGGPIAVGVETNKSKPTVASLALTGLPDADDGAAGPTLALNNSLGTRVEVLARDNFAAAMRELALARCVTSMAEHTVD